MTTRKSPRSAGEYLKNLTEVRDILLWIKNEVADEKSLFFLRRMLIYNFVFILFQLSQPIAIGMIFSGLASRKLSSVIYGIVGVVCCIVIQKIVERQLGKTREWVFGIHWCNLDRRVTELFFEKSPGQHIQETSLSVSSIERGKSRLFGLQEMVLFNAIPVVLQLILSFTLLAVMSLSAGIIMLLSIFAYLAYSTYLNFHVMRVYTPIDKSMIKLNKRRSERLEKVIRVIISSQGKREVGEMTEWQTRDVLASTNFWHWFIDKATWRSLINAVMFVGIICYGAYLVWNGVWQIGLLYPLYSWASRVTENIWQLGHIEHQINWNLPPVKSMIKALSIEPDVVDIKDNIELPADTPQRILVKDVSHAYPASSGPSNLDAEDIDDEEKDVEIPHTLKKVSFTIEPGEKVALLGSSGAGKTTLMRLLLRFMDPTDGSISVGSEDLRHVSRSSWLRSIGYIAQDPSVFDGTVRDNLTYRLSEEERANVSDEDLWKIMRELEIDFGERLDKGLETKVGKHGLKLSGGQAQRLMIGAAVIGNPWFMVIDEATSSLDSTTERKVQMGLEKVLSGNTSALIVAHRLSTVRHLCTKFVVLKPANTVLNGDSQVEAIGSSFEELYSTSPTFRQLANDQEIKIEKFV